MSKRTHSINRLHVASPCSVDWNEMTGDDKMRFCEHCNKHVHTLSTMTPTQIEALVASRKGQLCVRYFQDATGKVLTAENVVRLKAFNKRAPRFVAGAFSALLGLCTATLAQTPTSTSPATDNVKTEGAISGGKAVKQSCYATLTGFILDPNGAVIPGADVMLTNDITRQTKSVVSNNDGQFQFTELEAGTYSLNVHCQSFTPLTITNITLAFNQKQRIDATLEVGEQQTELIGVVALSGEEANNLPGFEWGDLAHQVNRLRKGTVKVVSKIFK